jgi:hypothetical protein
MGSIMAKKVIDYAVIVLIAILFGLALPLTGLGLYRIMTVEARATVTLEETKIQQQKLEKILEQINGRNP